jgi:hypothetical protein
MHPKPCWIIACTLLAGLAGRAEAQVGKAGEEKGDYIRVEVRGTLRTGIAAIGGETTGTLITAKGARWELDLSGNPAWRKLAEKLDGKKAALTGTLEVRPGVEIRQRWIVTVTSLKRPGPGEAFLPAELPGPAC